MRRTIIPKNNEFCTATMCDKCESSEDALKIKRLVATTKGRMRGSGNYLNVVLECKCINCGNKQNVQLVEMP